MATLSFANPTSGANAGAIGWIDFGNFTLLPDNTTTNVTVNFPAGEIMTFQMSNSPQLGGGFTFTATQPPVDGNSAFGTLGYTSIGGKVALYSNQPSNHCISEIYISNIAMVDSSNNPISNYIIVAVDAEHTYESETQSYITDGVDWQLLTTLGSTTSPQVIDVGTSSVIFNGNSATEAGAPVIYTQSPSNLIINIDSDLLSNQAFALGVVLTTVEIEKNITSRIDSTDQFTLSITGTPSDTKTTTGSTSGLQAEVAKVYAIPGNSYTINESMAGGSASTLAQYNNYVTWYNETPGGSVITNPGFLGETIIPAFGDKLEAYITNRPVSTPPTRGISFI